MASSFRDAELAGWSARSTSYDHYLSPITNQVTAPIISVLGPLGGKRVLDVCCGPGHLAGAMAAAGADVEGIDFAATMVTNARDNYPNLGFREGDAEALPYPDGAFDHVVCAFGVMHIGHPDAAMAEASRVLQPGGRYVFTQWAMDDEVLRIVLSAIADHGAPVSNLPAAPPPLRFSDPIECRRALEFGLVLQTCAKSASRPLGRPIGQKGYSTSSMVGLSESPLCWRHKSRRDATDS